MKTVKIRPTDPLSEAVSQAKRAGWYILVGGILIVLVGMAIFYSTINSLGLLGLIPSLIGVIIMLPGLVLIGWGWRLIRIKIK
jgi:hypothetical protein